MADFISAVATSKAMMDALIRLAEKRSECCAFYHLLVGESSDHTIPTTTQTSSNFSYGPNLHDSQKLAIDSIDTPISLIWGPPGELSLQTDYISILTCAVGTGKTTVVVQILRKLIEEATEEGLKILMTASTHNGQHHHTCVALSDSDFSCRQRLGAIHRRERSAQYPSCRTDLESSDRCFQGQQESTELYRGCEGRRRVERKQQADKTSSKTIGRG